MKYAVIADIHGNCPALQAVLKDAENRGITHFLFAGDYCISGPRPDECLTMIREIPEKTVIRGNEEKYLEDLEGKDPSQWTDGQMQISYWTYRNVRRENLEYVLSLPHTADFECGGVQVHMAHSSVDFIGTHTFYTWNSCTVAERNKMPDADPAKILADMAEERRLLYVGLTRASEVLCLSSAKTRSVYGRTASLDPSGFLDDVLSAFKRTRLAAHTRQTVRQRGLFS